MDRSTKDRNTAAATPMLVLIAAIAVAPWLMLVLPPLLYLLYRNRSLAQAQDVALKLFDLVISLIVLGGGLGALIGALSIVARDGEIVLPLISDGSLISIVALCGGLYLLAVSVRMSHQAFRQRPYKPALSMGMFEALRGKPRVAPDEPHTPA